jgi:hypothetical protein
MGDFSITLVLAFAGIVTAIVTSVVAPLLMAHLTTKNRRQEKAEDYARQDAVAAQVKAAAVQTAEAAKLLVASNAEVAATAKETTARTNEKLDVLDTGQKDIHALVDGDKTARMQAQLVSLEAQLVLMREVMSLTSDVGKKPTVESMTALETMKSRIAELASELSERLKLLKPPAAGSA